MPPLFSEMQQLGRAAKLENSCWNFVFPGNPLNGSQAFVYKCFLKPIVVTSVVKLNPLTLVFTFKNRVL